MDDVLLDNRTQFVSIDGAHSNNKPMPNIFKAAKFILNADEANKAQIPPQLLSSYEICLMFCQIGLVAMALL